jgi:transcriptional antiterminator RfaH
MRIAQSFTPVRPNTTKNLNRVLRYPPQEATFAAMSWTVLYLRPRCEKKMADHCRILRLTHYLPLREESKIYQRRRVNIEKPVFPGYLFVCLTPFGRLGLQKTNHIVRILEPEDEQQLLHELDQIRKALCVDPTLGACAALHRGRRVLIKGGPFMGIEGVVRTAKGKAKIRLNVEMIGQAVAVEVDREYLETID